MSSINSIGATPPPRTPPTPPPPTAVPAQAVAQAAKAASTTALPPGSYKNTSGDTVDAKGIVLVDRDGDGGVGKLAPKPKPAASQQEKLANTYSAH